MRKLILLPLLLFCIHCKKQPATPTGVVAENAMVVSARAEASKIGSDILAQGGNAFDAMVATEMALAVAYPFAGNLGGGGFMVYRKSDGDVGALDYREKAPLSAHKDMYLDSLGNVIPGKSTVGATAERGVVVSEKQAKRMGNYAETLLEVNGDSVTFPLRCAAGDTIKYPALANTLKKIAQNGRDEFYRGETAKKLAKFIQDKGGYVTVEDLAKYEAKWRQPVIFKYKDLKIISMSPPSSGGVTMNQIFKMIAPYDIEDYGHNQAKTIQLFTEASRRAYADRNYYLGDPDFVDIPLDVLLSDGYLKERMGSFSFDKATKSSWKPPTTLL